MARRPHEPPPPDDPEEIHTADVEPLPDPTVPSPMDASLGASRRRTITDADVPWSVPPVETEPPRAKPPPPVTESQLLPDEEVFREPRPKPARPRLAQDLEQTPRVDARSVERLAAAGTERPAPRKPPEPLFEAEAPFVSGAQPLPPDSMQVEVPVPEPAERVFLTVVQGAGAGTSIALPEGEHPIGRASNCFLCLADSSVSREHALVLRRGSRFFLRDAGSQSGTRLNSRRVEGSVEVFPGDQIQLGAVVLTLRSGSVTDPELTMPGVAFDEPRRKPPSPTLLYLGAFATAVGSAALASVLLTPVGERLFRPPPGPAPATAAATPLVARPAPPPPAIPAAPSPDLSLTAEPEIGIRPEGTSEDAPVPTPLPVARPAPRRPAPRIPPEPAANPVPEQSPTTASAEALQLFSDGQVDEAIALARRGSSSLAAKLLSFQREVAAAQGDLSFQDGAGAIRHFAAAVAIDQELTHGWSKPGGQARNELTRLLVMAAERVMPQNPAQAEALLEKALKYDPGHERAQALLETAKERRVKTERPAPPPTKDPRSAGDEAFGD